MTFNQLPRDVSDLIFPVLRFNRFYNQAPTVRFHLKLGFSRNPEYVENRLFYDQS